MPDLQLSYGVRVISDNCDIARVRAAFDTYLDAVRYAKYISRPYNPYTGNGGLNHAVIVLLKYPTLVESVYINGRKVTKGAVFECHQAEQLLSNFTHV